VGAGLIALELAALSHFPIDIFGQLHGSPMPLHLHVSPQTFLDSACASLLVTAAVVLMVAHRLSRTNIVAAIRNLDTSPAAPRRLVDLWHDVRAHRTDAVGALLARLFLCGPFSLLLGAGLVAVVAVIPPAHRNDPLRALEQLGWAVAIAGCGFLLQWVLSTMPGLSGLARRVGHSLIGIGWLGLGLVTSDQLFLLFKPTGNTFDTGSFAVGLATTVLLFVVGTVLLVTANLDLLVRLLTALTARVRGLAPISRTSLSTPLTFPFRVMVTVSELGLVIFLVVLIITMNVGTNNAAQAATATGGFQLQGIASRPIADLPGQVRQDPSSTARSRSWRPYTGTGPIRPTASRSTRSSSPRPDTRSRPAPCSRSSWTTASTPTPTSRWWAAPKGSDPTGRCGMRSSTDPAPR
jgi:putative ABC transport system permease protein